MFKSPDDIDGKVGNGMTRTYTQHSGRVKYKDYFDKFTKDDN